MFNVQCSSLLYQQHYHLQCQVEEYDFGVSVLSYVANGTGHQIADGQDVGFVDEACKVACKLLLAL